MKYPPVKELREFYEAMHQPMQLVPLLEQITKFLNETAGADTPLMTKMVIQLADREPQPIVLLWATANVAQSPLLRIEELKTENRRLKHEVSRLLAK